MTGKRFVYLLDRRWRLATASFRMLPTFIVIGVQKGGTTSFFWNLADHPNVLRPGRKEVQAFDRGRNFSKRFYQSWFPFAPLSSNGDQRMITGEATPTYLLNPASPARVKRLVPDVKLIVMLRNPVDRAVSQYRQNLKANREPLDLKDALEAESERVAASIDENRNGSGQESLDWLLFRYRGNGEYASHLQNWLRHFDQSQFMIFESEQYFLDPQRVLFEVHDFLGIPRHTYSSFPVMNRSKVKID
ncbi:MAG: sulfotransferase domain-containing protein, partial [Rhodothermia bacterium]